MLKLLQRYRVMLNGRQATGRILIFKNMERCLPLPKRREAGQFSGQLPFVKNTVARLLLLPLQTPIIPVDGPRG